MTLHPRAALITIAVAPAAGLPARLAADVEKAADLARQEKAKATQRAYATDFGIFRAWCAGRGVSELPATPEMVAAFLASEVERGIRSSTIGRRVAALRYAHKLAGLPLPTDDERVRATVRGIRHTTGTAAAKKAPVTAERLLAMVVVPGCTLAALRDRALLLLGFAGAFRRSELVALDVADFEETSEGLKITIRQSKTDQEAAGSTIAVVRGSVACPAKALKALACGCGHPRGADIPANQQGGEGSAAANDGSVGHAHRKSPCRARRTRSVSIFRPLASSRIPHISRKARRVHFQDDGREPPPLSRYAARLCPRCRDFQGSRPAQACCRVRESDRADRHVISPSNVRSWRCVKKTRKRHAVREMKVGPSESPCRGRLQTAISCFGQKPRW
jgi:Phage integrase, N-terminal SAM-like domain